ncbi:hypothetical protein C0J45_2765 [Silurus meridionalis]|uniref:Endonuclease/exonuclease/phosphatase domain-containing protein n=1 Tax=Silurus meridionalis TaxID=175797 RepID=A0A8T0BST8_SILME|nr:hypothetical protein HF521_016343 [Silurus meridionalis]KAI5107127.1 hypothetical protein C0J45_2765 [Silurus meridionalis]
MINVISAYAPQVGCEMKEKKKFWSELDEVVEDVPSKERLVVGADFNSHVGEGNRGDEEVMVVMDRLMDEVRQESPWTMMFVDDIVICGSSKVLFWQKGQDLLKCVSSSVSLSKGSEMHKSAVTTGQLWRSDGVMVWLPH